MSVRLIFRTLRERDGVLSEFSAVATDVAAPLLTISPAQRASGNRATGKPGEVQQHDWLLPAFRGGST